MGRIKTKLVKRTTKDLLKNHKEKFTDKFEENKHIVEKFVSLNSKRLRNLIAGHITKLIKKERY